MPAPKKSAPSLHRSNTPKKFLPFLAGLAAGALITWALFQPWRADQLVQDYYLFGDQKGLPEPEMGEFRLTIPDGFRTTKVTEKEFQVLTNVIGRQKEFRNYPQPVSELKALQPDTLRPMIPKISPQK